MKKTYFLFMSVVMGLLIFIFSTPLFAEEGISEKNAIAPAAENSPAEASDEPLFDNQEAALHYKEALLWYKKRSYSKAIDELEKATEINPDYKEAYYLLGYAYYKEGKMDLSREAFNQVYELDPKYSPLPPK